MPAVVTGAGSLLTSPLAVTLLTFVKIGVVHTAVALGPHRFLHSFPTRRSSDLPLKCAVSLIVPPAVPLLAVVLRVGVALLTVEVSPRSPEQVSLGSLLAHLVYGVVQ